MISEGWTWADLDERQLALVREAEETLGSEVVIAYRQAEPARVGRGGVAMSPAALDESQLECLQGIESRIGCVAVAYGRRTGNGPTEDQR